LQAVKPSLAPSLTEFIVSGKTKVECERGKIDILISDEKHHCIIIENKINDAPDMENQLPRYLKKAHEEYHLEPLAVVYMSWSKSPPTLDSYSKEYQNYVAELGKKRIVLHVVGTDDMDLVSGFVKHCAELQTQGVTERARIYLTDYANALVNIGGTMTERATKEQDMALLKCIFKDEASIAAAEGIADVWEKRRKIISNIVQDQVEEQLTGEMGYAKEENECWFKKLGNIRICLWDSVTYGKFALGYTPSNGKFTAKTKEFLAETIKALLPNAWFVSDRNDNECVDRWFNIELYPKPLEQSATYMVGRLKALEEEAKNVHG